MTNDDSYQPAIVAPLKFVIHRENFTLPKLLNNNSIRSTCDRIEPPKFLSRFISTISQSKQASRRTEVRVSRTPPQTVLSKRYMVCERSILLLRRLPVGVRCPGGRSVLNKHARLPPLPMRASIFLLALLPFPSLRYYSACLLRLSLKMQCRSDKVVGQLYKIRFCKRLLLKVQWACFSKATLLL